VFFSVVSFYSVIEIVSRLDKVGLKRLNFDQTIYHNSTEIRDMEGIKAGCGEGSFVVVRAGR
jgi:acyl-CoA thioesterase FadM